jgi:hypothetical protein
MGRNQAIAWETARSSSLAEVLVDCVTYCALRSVGLDVGGESIPCVAGSGGHGAVDAIPDLGGGTRAGARASRRACMSSVSVRRRRERAARPDPE